MLFSEWIYSVHFLTATAEWSACMLYILLFPTSKRKQRGPLFYVLMLCVQTALVHFMTQGFILVSVFLDIWIRISLFVSMMWIFLYLSCDTGKKEITYSCLKAFLTAEFLWGLVISVLRGLSSVFPEETQAFYWLIIVCVYASVLIILYAVERYYGNKLQNFPITIHEVCVVAVICVLTLLFDSSKIFRTNFPLYDTTGKASSIPKFMADFIGIFTVLVYRIWFTNLQMKHNMEILQKIIETQSRQFEQSKANIDMVNQKYHDLKNQLLLVKAQISRGQQTEALDEIEREIEQYDTASHTGNPVLDTILTEKRILCLQKDITFQYVVDGKLFSRIEAADLCTIFGNALDNAIECVSRIPEKDKRLIHVGAYVKSSLLMVSFENICEEALTFHNGLPVTTKPDRMLHGYGLRGILQSVQKYNGSITVKADNGWFELLLLIPLE